MSRFEYDDDGEGMPWQLWNTVVSNALGGRKGQEALAEMETALLALPERKLIEGNLAADGAVCGVGAFVAHRRAQREGVDIKSVIEAMAAGVKCWCGHGRESHADDGCSGKLWEDRPCDCDGYDPSEEQESALETAEAGHAEGLAYTVAWHLAHLNDEKFASATPEGRYDLMLAWVQRAQGKESMAA